MNRQKWTSHTFNLGIDPGWSANIIARLLGTAIRLQHYVNILSEEQASKRINNKWSVKEHIGHLIDLEELHLKRLHEFNNFASELSAADMSNKATEFANHNAKSAHELMASFKEERQLFLDAYFALRKDCLNHPAMHPRLKVPMKPVDLLFFVAEHDDHHIASILEIKDQIHER